MNGSVTMAIALIRISVVMEQKIAQMEVMKMGVMVSADKSTACECNGILGQFPLTLSCVLTKYV